MVAKTPPSMTVKLAKKGQVIVLHCEVENRGPEDIYLLNVLYRPGPDWFSSPDLIYIEVQADKKLLCLFKRIDNIPANRNVVYPVAPFLTPVRVGDRFAEEVHIPYPVEEYREYGFPSGSTAPGTVMCNGIVFVLGYYSACDGLKEEIQDIGGIPSYSITAPPQAKLDYGELQSPTIQMEVPALVRRI